MTRHIIVWTFLLLSPLASLRADGLQESIDHYERNLQRIRETIEEQQDLLKLRYAQELDGARQAAMQAGDLDGVLLITEEQRRARSGEELSAELPEEIPDGLRAARRNLEEGMRNLRATQERQEATLLENYLQHLQDLQRRLTVENEIDAALAVRAEHQRRLAERAEISVTDVEPAPEQPESSSAPFLAIRWHRGMRPGTMDVQYNQATGSLPIQVGDANRQGARGLELRGGTTELRNLPDEVLAAFKASNELSLMVYLHTDHADQRGPARIVSFSRDAALRNFTLGQQRDQLVMRLRTSETDLNGLPQINLGLLRPNTVNRLVFTYRPGEAKLYRDGREVQIRNLQGDFSNWSDHFIVLGNEKTGGRAWQGRLEAVQIINRVLPPAEAIRLSAGQLQ